MHALQRNDVFPRRHFLRLSAASLLASSGWPVARAAEPGNVPTVHERIQALADDAPLAMQFTGTTAEECRRWQAEFADKLRSLLGPHQPPRKWDSRLERTVELDDHTREERLLVAAGLAPVPFHLLLPHDDARGPQGTRARKRLPAVLAVHGHGPMGYDPVAGLDDTPEQKDAIARNNYDYGRQLVRRGYVVAAPCLTPFGRRLGPSASDRKGDSCAATFVRLQLLGRLLMAENLRDILWTLEYLVGHEAVDPQRLACVGLSYGGRMTMLTTALEPRIKAAVMSGALNCMQERISLPYSGGCQVIPGLLKYGDVPEIGSLIAPRPCVWEVGSHDSLLKPEWVEKALVRMRRAYRALGAEDRLEVDRFEGGHQWHGALAYPMLKKVLKS